MDDSRKRGAPDEDSPDAKRTKGQKQWRTPHGAAGAKQRRNDTIRIGDRGIWVTCHKNKEKKSIGELYDLFEDYAERRLGPVLATEAPDASNGTAEEGQNDIEQDIMNEVQGIRKPSRPKLFDAVWTDIQCVLFFRTSAAIDPLTVTQEILEEAMSDPARKRTRFTQRLTPAPSIGYASEEGLEKTAREALAPHFHTEPVTAKKFAIRPTFRNHSTLKRDGVIKGIATLVGPPHTVDLTNYDLLILVDIMKNVCSVCVVDTNYDRLKRFNLQEIYEPTPVAPARVPAMEKQKSDASMGDA